MIYSEFIRNLGEFTKVSTKSAEELTSLLKSVETDVASFDSFLKRSKVSKLENGLFKINDLEPGKFHELCKSGDLRNLCKSDPSIIVTSHELSAFEKLNGHFSELKIRKYDELSVKNQRFHPDLIVDTKEIDQLEGSAKRKAEQLDKNITKSFSSKTTIALLFGTFIVGVSLSKFRRRGCYLIDTLNGSCLVKKYSCVENIGYGTECEKIPDGLYNMSLILITIIKRDDTDADKLEIAKIAKVDVKDLDKKLNVIVKSAEFSQIYEYITALKTKPELNVCDKSLVHSAIDDGKIPVCRLCSTSSSPLSTEYVDPTLFAENFSFKCVVSENIVDVASDIVFSTGKNIFRGITNFISRPVKFLLWVAVFMIILLVLWTIVKSLILKKPRNENIDIPPSSNINPSAYSNTYFIPDTESL